MGRPYREDQRRARAAAYTHRNNPFEEGARLHRLCEKARRQRENMDALFEDMEEVCGQPAGVRKPMVQNQPGSFKGPLQ